MSYPPGWILPQHRLLPPHPLARWGNRPPPILHRPPCVCLLGAFAHWMSSTVRLDLLNKKSIPPHGVRWGVPGMGHPGGDRPLHNSWGEGRCRVKGRARKPRQFKTLLIRCRISTHTLALPRSPLPWREEGHCELPREQLQSARDQAQKEQPPQMKA